MEVVYKEHEKTKRKHNYKYLILSIIPIILTIIILGIVFSKLDSREPEIKHLKYQYTIEPSAQPSVEPSYKPSYG